MINLDKLRKPLLYLIALALTAGLIVIPLFHGKVSFSWLPALMLSVCTILLILYHKGDSKRTIVVFSIIGVLGWIIEVVGYSTGSIFGNYSFGEVLGLKLLGVPILIAIGWAMVTYMAFVATSMLPLNNRRLTASAGLMVLFDIVLEPTASRMGMWQFANNDVPFSNFVIWFLLGMLLLQIVRRSRASFSNPIAAPLFAMLLIFMLLLNIISVAIKA